MEGLVTTGILEHELVPAGRLNCAFGAPKGIRILIVLVTVWPSG